MEDTASKISVIFVYSMTEKTKFLGSCFPRSCKDTSKGRWNNKSPFNIVLTQQHLCNKLPKSVNVRLSYSVLHQCRFFQTQCIMISPNFISITHSQ